MPFWEMKKFVTKLHIYFTVTAPERKCFFLLKLFFGHNWPIFTRYNSNDERAQLSEYQLGFGQQWQVRLSWCFQFAGSDQRQAAS
jgi:hypothetical protein